MSKEQRPNLHAVGLMTDIMKAIDERRRGNAKAVPFPVVMGMTARAVEDFVETIDAFMNLCATTGSVAFASEMNDIIAPVTRAWTDFEIEQAQIRPGDIADNRITLTLIVTAKRKEPA